ncbi:MAG: helix-turn-helix transcriptional regulator [Tannerella sp.]|jgi:transcriptional regulator with XRE-family HTH domain|nr:helix-turn-helix transcriptional regulator [Tannerella sp.]
MQKQIVAKIKRLRQEKGLTLPQMAEKLKIDRSAYALLESGETYSWAKYFEELMTILEITPEKFFEGIGNNVVINNNKCSNGGNANVENLYAYNKELYDKLIAAKDDQIAFLKSLLGKKQE